jgi:hypothetical protein
MACGQRGWKWQPLGGLIGLGTSPGQHHFLAPLVGMARQRRREQALV